MIHQLQFSSGCASQSRQGRNSRRTMEAGGSSLYRFGHGPQWTTRASNFGTTNTSRTSRRHRVLWFIKTAAHCGIMMMWHCSSTSGSWTAVVWRDLKNFLWGCWTEFQRRNADLQNENGIERSNLFWLLCHFLAPEKGRTNRAELQRLVLQSCNRKSIRHPKKQK